MNQQQKSWLIDLTILTLLIGLIYFATLGFPPLYIPDEGRYAEIPREMLLNHQYIIPYLDGVIYFEKPPLIYWFVAFFEHTFGYSEWAVRAVNAVMAILTCLSVYIFSRHYYNRTAGYFAALTLASSLLFFGVAHILTLDMGLTFFLTLTLLFFYAGLNDATPTPYKFFCKKSLLLWAGYACAALVVLTKGLIGLIFPGLIIFSWMLITNQWSYLKSARIISGIILLILIALPWHLLAQKEVPSFFYQYIIVQQFLRFLTPVMHRQMGLTTYCLVFIASFLPWIVFSCIYFKKLFKQLKQRKLFKKEWFFLCWIFGIFLFFAFSSSILITYLQPIMPALALFTAPYLANLWQSGQATIRRTLIILIAASSIIFNIAWVVAPSIANKSTKPLAMTVNALLKTHPDAALVSYNYYYQDFPYYTKRYVLIVNWVDELGPGYSVQPDAAKIMISDEAFWQLVNSDKVVYIITNNESYDSMQKNHPNKIFLLNRTKNYVLLTNAQGMTP